MQAITLNDLIMLINCYLICKATHVPFVFLSRAKSSRKFTCQYKEEEALVLVHATSVSELIKRFFSLED
jgi:hypothetical protein